MGFMKPLSFLSLATAALAVPTTLTRSEKLPESGDICVGESKCIPFAIDLTWGSANPTNGQARNVILTNGSFPGPALKMKVGECVDFTVHNKLPFKTGIHFHGIQQTGTPWSDGVPGLSQYAIESDSTYMYRWTADEEGTYFYHSHYKGQIMDGLYGAIHIQAKDGDAKPFSAISSSEVAKLQKAEDKVEPIFVSDWSQFTFDQFHDIEKQGNIDIACADSIILNGMGSVYCLTRDQITKMQSPAIPRLLGNSSQLTNKACIPPTTVATQGNYTRNLAAVPAQVFDTCTPSTNKNYTYVVDPADGWAAISLISPAGFEMLKATIDNHKLYVYEFNGRYITPQVVDQVPIGNGDRVSFFVKLDQPAGDYAIRVANQGLNQLISGYGYLSYRGSKGNAGTPVMDFGGNNLTQIVTFAAAKAAPFVPIPVAQSADKTFKLAISKLPGSPNAYEWTLGGKTAYSMDNDDNTPLLYQDPASITQSDIVLKTNMGQWVDLIIETRGPLAQPHPIHKHANKFFAIGSGLGSFNWSSVAEAQAAGIQFNLNNPTYADGMSTVPSEKGATWTVFRYEVEIAGAWFLHCHMQTHFSGGMALAILDGVDNFPKVPKDAGKVCPGKGASNSTWTPSCFCPASCPANGGNTGSNSGNSNSGSNNGGSNAGAWNNWNPSDNSTGTNGYGSWNNGVWNGPHNPAANNGSSVEVSNTGGAATATSGGKGSSTSTSGPIATFTGAASSAHISLFTIVAGVVMALSL